MKKLNQVVDIDIDEEEEPSKGSGFNPGDYLQILFKHKWKVLLLTLAGLAAAATLFVKWPRLYVSEAKLFVKYIVDRAPVDAGPTQGSRRDESVIASELEILTSRDLAVQVAESLGVARLMPNAGDIVTPIEAASVVASGLTASGARGGDVITVTYKHSDPALAPVILTALVESYFKKHLEVHRASKEAFEFVTQQNLQLQANLRSIEDELKQKRAEAKVTSLPEALASLNAEMAACRKEINAADAELAGLRAVLDVRKESDGPGAGVAANPGEPVQQPESGDVLRYQSLVKSLSQLRDAELGLRAKFTGESKALRLNQAQIAELEAERRALEKKMPAIAVRSGAGDHAGERAMLAGTEAKRNSWEKRLREIETRISELSALAPKIVELERRKEIEETNLKAAMASLEQARRDDLLSPSKMPNIAMVQKPSPSRVDMGKANKFVMGLAFGGLALGVALALLIELFLDRRVKRPIEVETLLGVPLMLSVPLIPGAGQLRLKAPADDSAASAGGGGSAPGAVAPWALGHFIRRYAESIRDRLVMYFEVNGLGHKPKLVAVTGVLGGEGASTIAGGLAAALSETGDGKVLLVDMHPRNANAHPFFRGKPSTSLAEAIQGSAAATEAGDNLYLATNSSADGKPAAVFPKRFYEMVPNFKATDYDYIIFDMPPLAESSATLAMAPQMDKVLLVVEAEKGGRDMMKRACDELSGAGAKVSGIFNKARSYGPKWLAGDEVGAVTLPWPSRGGSIESSPSRRRRRAFRVTMWILLLLVVVAAACVAFLRTKNAGSGAASKEAGSPGPLIGMSSATKGSREALR